MIYDPETPSPAGLTKSVLWERFGAQLIGDIDDKLLASVDELHNEARRRNYAEERAGGQYRGECRYLVNKHTGQAYEWVNARSLIGLTPCVEAKVKPADNPGFDIFVQSKAINRNLIPGTKMLLMK